MIRDWLTEAIQEGTRAMVRCGSCGLSLLTDNPHQHVEDAVRAAITSRLDDYQRQLISGSVFRLEHLMNNVRVELGLSRRPT